MKKEALYLVLDRKICKNVLSEEEIKILDKIITKVRKVEGYREYKVERIE